MTIHNLEQLEELLSRPTQADCDFMASLDGDLMVLGVAGKMGPSLALRARRAAEAAGVKKRIVGVARFSNPAIAGQLEAGGVEVIQADLLGDGLASLPDIPNIVYMAARKFGTTGNEYLTWAMNTYLPGLVAARFPKSRIAAFSTGNVYPLVPVTQGGPAEATPVAPVGEYGITALGRERMFEYFSAKNGTPVTILRLNYAVEMRYGVLLDIGLKVYSRRPIDLAMGSVNVIWQGDANSVAMRSLGIAASPPEILNLTGPETLAVRQIARRFGRIFGVEPVFEGTEAATALLSNAARCHRLFGYPAVSVDQLIDWTAEWIRIGGAMHNKPTHFQVRDGAF